MRKRKTFFVYLLFKSAINLRRNGKVVGSLLNTFLVGNDAITVNSKLKKNIYVTLDENRCLKANRNV